MKILKNTRHHNFEVNVDHYTQDELELLEMGKVISKLNGKYVIYDDKVQEIKVVLYKESKTYGNVVVTNDGRMIRIIL